MDVTTVLNAATTVSLLFIVAAGLAVIFGVMGVVNLAHGEFLMLGAYASFLVADAGLPIWLSILVAPLVLGVLALVLEPVLFRFLYGRMWESILATWGLGIVLRQVVEILFGRGYHDVQYPISGSIPVFGADYSIYRLVIILVAISLAGVLFWIERRTTLGTTARAVVSNRSLASSLGVNVNRVYKVTLVFGSALAGLAGALVVPLTSAYPTMGLGFVTNAFLAVLVAGLGSLPGLLLSSSVLGGVQSAVSVVADPVWGSIALVVVALVMVRLRYSV